MSNIKWGLPKARIPEARHVIKERGNLRVMSTLPSPEWVRKYVCEAGITVRPSDLPAYQKPKRDFRRINYNVWLKRVAAQLGITVDEVKARLASGEVATPIIHHLHGKPYMVLLDERATIPPEYITR